MRRAESSCRPVESLIAAVHDSTGGGARGNAQSASARAVTGGRRPLVEELFPTTAEVRDRPDRDTPLDPGEATRRLRDHDPNPGHERAEPAGGPLNSLLLEVTGWSDEQMADVALLITEVGLVGPDARACCEPRVLAARQPPPRTGVVEQVVAKAAARSSASTKASAGRLAQRSRPTLASRPRTCSPRTAPWPAGYAGRIRCSVCCGALCLRMRSHPPRVRIGLRAVVRLRPDPCAGVGTLPRRSGPLPGPHRQGPGVTYAAAVVDRCHQDRAAGAGADRVRRRSPLFHLRRTRTHCAWAPHRPSRSDSPRR